MTIFKLARRGIRASLGRLILTTIAILAGVGFVSGAFILADSLESTFTSLFEDASADIDARVTVAEFEFGTDERTIPDTLADELEALPEVGDVTPEVALEDSFTPFVALDADGDEVKPPGPIVTFSWNGDEGGGLSLGDGRPPRGLDETAIDSAYAEALEAAVGDVVTFTTPDGLQDFTIAGIVDFEITAGAYFVLFDFESAQTLYDKEGVVDAISLSRAPGVTTEELIAAVERVVPSEAEVLDQAEVIEDQTAQFEQIIGIFRTILLVFAGIALFVSLFIIYNTFAILVTQRLQQIGMLRAVGATRGQVRGWVLVEAILVGVVGSVLGLAAGFGVALLIKAGFQAGGGFPETDTILRPRTVYVALAVGMLATIASALVPALWASRIPPMAAIRPERSHVSIATFRVMAGAVMLLVGAILMGLGLAGRTSATTIAGIDLSTGWVIGLEFGGGAVLLFVGMFLFSVLFAGPVVNFIGRPAVLGGAMLGLGAALVAAMFVLGDGFPDSFLPTEVVDGVEERSFSIGNLIGWISFGFKLAVAALSIAIGGSILGARAQGRSGFGIGGAAGGIEGHLARRNAARSPIRTAATATALTIGIALVSTVSVVGESLKASFTSTLDRSIQADLFIYDDETGGSFSGELADQLDSVEGLVAVSRFRANEIRIDDDVDAMAAYDADTGTALIDFGVSDGSPDGLLDGGILVFRDEADDRGLSVGDRVSVEFPDLEAEELVVSGIFEDNSVLTSPWVIDIALYEQHIRDDDDLFVAASIADDADPEAVKVEVLAATESFSSVTAQDNQEFIDSQEGQVDSLVNLINYLLGFALFVAFVGVINTIVLSVVERTREIGLLRAVGTTQAQVRAVVRWEAVIVCLFGALLGIALGVLFGWAAVSAIPDDVISDVAIPFESVVFTILIAAIAGVVAAVVPAYLAAKRNVLEAVAAT